MPMQIRRTATPNLPPTGLAEGQLGVEMAGTRPRLWIGVPTAVDASGRRLLVPSGAVSSATAPATPQTGDLWYDSTNDLLKYFDGTTWQALLNPSPVDGNLYGQRDGEWSLIPIPEIPQGTSILPVGGQLRLSGSSPSPNLIYVPFNGNWLRVDGEDYPIPLAGFSATITNATIDGVAGQTLTDMTMYFVYAFIDASGNLAMEFSQTGHQASTDPDNLGTEIKQADETRSLIGFVFPMSGQFLDDLQSRLVRSWLNPTASPAKIGTQNWGSMAGAWYTSPTDCTFLLWANETAQIIADGNGTNTAPTGNNNFGVGVNYAATPNFMSSWSGTESTPITVSNTITAATDARFRLAMMIYPDNGGINMFAGLNSTVLR